MSDLTATLITHEYQEWDTNDGLLYPVESSPTVCKCGATPGLPPPEGDWAWWVAHVTPLLQPDGPLYRRIVERHHIKWSISGGWDCNAGDACTQEGHWETEEKFVEEETDGTQA